MDKKATEKQMDMLGFKKTVDGLGKTRGATA